MLSDYLRRQADACFRIARDGFDLATAERLGRLGAELRAKANELDQQERDIVESHLLRGNSRPKQRSIP